MPTGRVGAKLEQAPYRDDTPLKDSGDIRPDSTVPGVDRPACASLSLAAPAGRSTPGTMLAGHARRPDLRTANQAAPTSQTLNATTLARGRFDTHAHLPHPQSPTEGSPATGG